MRKTRSTMINQFRALFRGKAGAPAAADFEQTIYAEKVHQFRGHPAPRTPSIEFPAVRFDESVDEFPIIVFD
ncbi:MAG: hypothetical protein ACOCYT_01890 [Chloroflexota bacterium]